MREPTGERVLVTGAAGFIGFHVTRALLARGYDVHGLDCMNDYYDVNLKRARLAQIVPSNTAACWTFDKVDVADSSALKRIMQDYAPSSVVHLAAQAGVRMSVTNPDAYAHSNLTGFFSVLEAVRSTKTPYLIFASSSSVYGNSQAAPFSESDPCNEPESFYAATKKANEVMARSYAAVYDMTATALRFFTVYGPWGRPDMAYFEFTRRILSGEELSVYGEGKLVRDFTYVSDIVDQIVELVRRGPDAVVGSTDLPTYEVLNIGGEAPVTVNQFVSKLEVALDRRAQVRYVDKQVGDVLRTSADASKIAARTGLRATVGLDEGLRRFVEWYLGYHDVSASAGSRG